jgi:hypothetical protein
MSVEPLAEHLLARSDRLIGIEPVESDASPRLLVALDNECRRVLVEPVAVRLKYAVLVLDEVEGECVEGKGRAEPDISRAAMIQIGLEMVSVFPANDTVDAIGGYDDVGIDSGIVLYIDRELEICSKLARAMLKNLKQFLSRYSAEAVPA